MAAVQQEHIVHVATPEEVAGDAGLRYVSDHDPGITRKHRGDGFLYQTSQGQVINDQRRLKRITALAIPPAWTDVWICPYANGHIQATGRDAKGRKQYRYHPRWRAVRDENKYEHILAFGQALPAIRQRVADDLAGRGLSREKVLAAVVRLLETTLIRVGNEEYAHQNKSYGLTTMRNRHVEVGTQKITFSFRGKSGKRHTISLDDRRLAQIVRRLRELPGQHLFQYVDDDGAVQVVSSGDVNDYLREITGQPFTAKDFRTWTGTMLAAWLLRTFAPFTTEREARHNIAQAIEQISAKLGNTPTICRKCYVHPAVLEAYVEGSLLEAIGQHSADQLVDHGTTLQPSEIEVLEFLKRRLADTR
jgi:DNA topoisomerase-1